MLHVHDLEVDAAFAVGHLNGGLLQRIAGLVERRILRRFDVVVTISDRMRERLLQKGLAADRVMVVRNWVDLSNIKPVLGSNSFRSELGLGDDDFVVLYSGQIGSKQALHLVFDAATRLLSDTRVHFVIAGDGPLKAQFVERYAGQRNVHFLPLQPEPRLCELLNLADLHILPQDRGAADLVLPSKLGGMLASRGQALVQADEGTELHNLLNGVTLLVPPGDVDALVREITTVKVQPYDAGRHRGVAELFARENSLPAFRDIIFAGGRQLAPRSLEYDQQQPHTA